MVAGVELHDAARSTGELALQVGRGAPVLRADQIGRGHALQRPPLLLRARLRVVRGAGADGRRANAPRRRQRACLRPVPLHPLPRVSPAPPMNAADPSRPQRIRRVRPRHGRRLDRGPRARGPVGLQLHPRARNQAARAPRRTRRQDRARAAVRRARVAARRVRGAVHARGRADAGGGPAAGRRRCRAHHGRAPRHRPRGGARARGPGGGVQALCAGSAAAASRVCGASRKAQCRPWHVGGGG